MLQKKRAIEKTEVQKKRLIEDKTFVGVKSVCFRRREPLRRLKFIQKKRLIEDKTFVGESH